MSLSKSKTGDLIQVVTRNNRYLLRVVDPGNNQVIISGGTRWVKPATVMIYRDRIAVGAQLRVYEYHQKKDVLISDIRCIIV
ncbi:hypothetical protein KKF05_03095 [Patescibacteria group bacterium]|nr:hypothetical protein [Patescibacteria group bacterium]